MNLAVAQLRQGNKEAAVATMQTALHFDPDNPELTKMLQQMR